MLRHARVLRKGARARLYASSSGVPVAKEEIAPEKQEPAAVNLKKRADVMRLFSVARPETKTLVGALGCLVVSTGTMMTLPWGMGQMMDVVNQGTALQLNHLTGLAIAVFAAGSVANYGREYLTISAGQRIEARLRSSLFAAVVDREMGFFDRTRVGELVSRLSADTAIVGKVITENVSKFSRSTMMALGGVGMMCYYSPYLTAVTVGVVIPVAFAARWFGTYTKRLSREVQDSVAASSAFVDERFSNVRTVRMFAQEPREKKTYAEKVETIFDLALRQGRASALFFSGTQFGANISALVCMYCGGKLVIDGVISVGELTSFLMYAGYVGASASGLLKVFGDIMKGLGASGRVFELLDAAPAAASGGRTLPALQGDIELKDVSFAYPTRPAATIFDGLSLKIARGSVTALVGASGTGKSSVLALLTRLYEPSKGSISLDGVDVRELDPEWLRNNIGVVSQEPVLFDGTIAENIAYAKPGATQAEIESAARLANAEDFILGFPDGYKTNVGERGISLSGGQKQRVAIARAVLKDPKILVWDEATSALDSVSERLVQQAIDRAMKGRTVIVITHRLSTIDPSANVALLAGGRIAEQGTLTELLARPEGAFRQLVTKQLIGGHSVPPAQSRHTTAPASH